MSDAPTSETETEDQKKQRAVRQGASNSQYHHPPLPIPSCHDRGLEARGKDTVLTLRAGVLFVFSRVLLCGLQPAV